MFFRFATNISQMTWNLERGWAESWWRKADSWGEAKDNRSGYWCSSQESASSTCNASGGELRIHLEHCRHISWLCHRGPEPSRLWEPVGEPCKQKSLCLARCLGTPGQVKGEIPYQKDQEDQDQQNRKREERLLHQRERHLPKRRVQGPAQPKKRGSLPDVPRALLDLTMAASLQANVITRPSQSCRECWRPNSRGWRDFTHFSWSLEFIWYYLELWGFVDISLLISGSSLELRSDSIFILGFYIVPSWSLGTALVLRSVSHSLWDLTLLLISGTTLVFRNILHSCWYFAHVSWSLEEAWNLEMFHILSGFCTLLLIPRTFLQLDCVSHSLLLSAGTSLEFRSISHSFWACLLSTGLWNKFGT